MPWDAAPPATAAALGALWVPGQAAAPQSEELFYSIRWPMAARKVSVVGSHAQLSLHIFG